MAYTMKVLIIAEDQSDLYFIAQLFQNHFKQNFKKYAYYLVHALGCFLLH